MLEEWLKDGAGYVIMRLVELVTYLHIVGNCWRHWNWTNGLTTVLKKL